MTELCKDTKCPQKENCLRFRLNVPNHSYMIERAFKTNPFKCDYMIPRQPEKTFTHLGDSFVFDMLNRIVNGSK